MGESMTRLVQTENDFVRSLMENERIQFYYLQACFNTHHFPFVKGMAGDFLKIGHLMCEEVWNIAEYHQRGIETMLCAFLSNGWKRRKDLLAVIQTYEVVNGLEPVTTPGLCLTIKATGGANPPERNER
jgi:hypothetical protein